MSCYLRYMKDVINDANLHPEGRKERKEVDMAIRQLVGMKAEDKCNVVWKEVKLWIMDENKNKKLTEGLTVK
jgi:hypothetical protein